MRRALSLCVTLLLTSIALYADETIQAAKLFERTYRGASTLSATFLETYSEGGEVVRSEAGTAYFRKPGKMRWEYSSPDKDLFLVDGKTAWFYVPADHTVTRMPAKQSEDWRTPFALLAGEAKISRICSRVTEDKSAQPQDHRLILLTCQLHGESKKHSPAADEALTPQNQPVLVQFELERDTGVLRKVVVHQRGSVTIEFHFANWEFNPPVSDKLFHFEVPMGVAIVNGELNSSGGRTGSH